MPTNALQPAEVLIDLFLRVALRDPVLLQSIDQTTMTINAELSSAIVWSFTLPELHMFAQSQFSIFNNTNYKTFRSLLLNSPINNALAAQHASIVITKNLEKVDHSIYSLQLNNR
jgi:hypothetical protein